jgi:protein-S-isoprenylcysteine O-methyltransferase Ste14
MSLPVRALLFTVAVPGAGGVYVPWLILATDGPLPQRPEWLALIPIVIGVAIYAWCLWIFGTVGRGTPATWDAPRRVVAVGPYRWVRNPIYLAALLIVAGEAWLFLSLPLLAYLLVLGLGFQVLVVGYEEPTLSRRFGAEYEAYRHRVPRWLPRLGRAR